MKTRIPRTLNEFLELEVVYPFDGVDYFFPKPLHEKDKRVYQIANAAERYSLVKIGKEYKRFRHLDKDQVKGLFMNGLRERLPNQVAHG